MVCVDPGFELCRTGALAVALRDMAASQVANIEPIINKRQQFCAILRIISSPIHRLIRWLSRLESGDVGLEVELTSAIASKEPTYGPRNCESCLSGQELFLLLLIQAQLSFILIRVLILMLNCYYDDNNYYYNNYYYDYYCYYSYYHYCYVCLPKTLSPIARSFDGFL